MFTYHMGKHLFHIQILVVVIILLPENKTVFTVQYLLKVLKLISYKNFYKTICSPYSAAVWLSSKLTLLCE